MLQVTTLPAGGERGKGAYEPIRCCCHTRLFDATEEANGAVKIQIKCKDCNAYTVLMYRPDKQQS